MSIPEDMGVWNGSGCAYGACNDKWVGVRDCGGGVFDSGNNFDMEGKQVVWFFLNNRPIVPPLCGAYTVPHFRMSVQLQCLRLFCYQTGQSTYEC